MLVRQLIGCVVALAVISGCGGSDEPEPASPERGQAETSGDSRAAAACIDGGMREFDSGGGHAFWRKEGREDYGDYIAATCRRADREGLLDRSGSEPQLQKIAGEVLLEMIERGQVRDPRKN
jgi:hypothetical protein